MGSGLLKLAKSTGGLTVKSGDQAIEYDEHGRNIQSVTKEGVEVKPGQVWQDLDKRMNGRKRRVIAVENGKAEMDGYPKTKVSIRRMHKGSTGWALVND